MKIEVYTDGSATIATKPGGYAYVIVVDGIKKVECSGSMPGASNNDAEMEAAIQGLARVFKMCVGGEFNIFTSEVYLVSDSQLVLGWANGTYKFKQQAEEKKKKYGQLQHLVTRMGVKTRWVRGHNGDEHNERCDKLANEARLSVSNKVEREEAKERGETLIGIKKSGVICLWYKDTLKVVDLETNVVENYNREIHGSRSSRLQIMGERSRHG